MAKLRNNIHYGSLLSSKNNYFFKILKNVTLLKIEKKNGQNGFFVRRNGKYPDEMEFSM